MLEIVQLPLLRGEALAEGRVLLKLEMQVADVPMAEAVASAAVRRMETLQHFVWVARVCKRLRRKIAPSARRLPHNLRPGARLEMAEPLQARVAGHSLRAPWTRKGRCSGRLPWTRMARISFSVMMMMRRRKQNQVQALLDPITQLRFCHVSSRRSCMMVSFPKLKQRMA